MTQAQNTTTTRTRTVRENGTSLVSSTVDITVTEMLPQEAHAVAVTVDFGDGSSDAVTTVTGQPWVKSTSRLSPSFFGSTDDHDAEDALLEGLRVVCTNITAGVGFEVRAHAPNGTHGIYNVHVIGV